MVIPYLSVCSGIEAFSVAVSQIPEWQAAGFAEIEPFPSMVLHHHYGCGRPMVLPTPKMAKAVAKIPAWDGKAAPNYGDFTQIDVKGLPDVHWLVGGTPCQSFSIAGLRKGLSDDRGNLTLEYVRLAHALKDNNGLRGLLWENVPGVLSDKSNAFGCFVAAIVGHDDPLVTPDGGRWPDAGMVAGPRARLAWRVCDSQFFGVAQRRRRVFVVADFGNWFDPATVLFEPGGQIRRTQARRETREEIAGTLGGSSQSGGVRTTDLDNNGAFVVAPVSEYLGNAEGGNAEAPSLNASNGAKGINNQTPLVMVAYSMQAGATRTNPNSGPDGVGVQEDVAYTIEARAEVQSVVAFGSKGSGADAGPISPTLRASGHDGSHANGGSPPAVAFNLRGREGGNMPELGGEKASALRSADGGSSAPMGMIGTQVRRLTPTECERLQGFPDGHTLIPGLSGWRDMGDDENPDELREAGLTVKQSKSGKWRVNDPDGPRYKSLGNSFTVEPVNWIMTRVTASMAGLPMPAWQPMQLWSKPRQ